MKNLVMEWRHLDLEGKTCVRCSATGKTLLDVVDELATELRPLGINVSLKEVLLSEEKLNESNMILINGIPLEKLLPDAGTSETCCDSCSCLTGSDVYCRTVEYGGVSYEEIPESLIRQAVKQALEKESNG
ncbi:MAG: DUF2703 domain-containing protein [Actinomycetota bacterium]